MTIDKRPMGRPRSLSRAAIIEVACELGLDKLEMSRVAERLNTGVATLYGYVRGREHLLQLAADRSASLAFAIEDGSDWREVIRQHGEMCYSMFQSNPGLICNLIGGQGDDDEIVYGRNLVALLVAGGLSRTDAIIVYIEANQAVIGAAVMCSRREMLARHSLDEEGNYIPLPSILGDFRPALERIIAAFEMLNAPSP